MSPLSAAQRTTGIYESTPYVKCLEFHASVYQVASGPTAAQEGCKMRPRPNAVLLIAFLLSVPSVLWAEAAPPVGSKPLTEILRPIEARSDFAYFEEVELEEGKYKIEYFKKDGSKHKIEVDPLTGTLSESAPAR
jgi:hypothetical protein